MGPHLTPMGPHLTPVGPHLTPMGPHLTPWDPTSTPWDPTRTMWQTRGKMKDELIRAEGRLKLLGQLQEGCMAWPEVTIAVGGETVSADRRWNQGLSTPEKTCEGGREPTNYEEERRCGRFCYFCATLDPPIRVQHKLVDCPKRKKGNVREYRPEAMGRARELLRDQRYVCESKLAEHKAATEAVRAQKQALLELAGAIKVPLT
jgi:hypothetical protein